MARVQQKPAGAAGLAEYAEELRSATADELETDAQDTGAEQLLGVGRAIVFALQEVAARLELLEVGLGELVSIVDAELGGRS